MLLATFAYWSACKDMCSTLKLITA